jgi:hypothetical protein
MVRRAICVCEPTKCLYPYRGGTSILVRSTSAGQGTGLARG